MFKTRFKNIEYFVIKISTDEFRIQFETSNFLKSNNVLSMLNEQIPVELDAAHPTCIVMQHFPLHIVAALCALWSCKHFVSILPQGVHRITINIITVWQTKRKEANTSLFNTPDYEIHHSGFYLFMVLSIHPPERIHTQNDIKLQVSANRSLGKMRPNAHIIHHVYSSEAVHFHNIIQRHLYSKVIAHLRLDFFRSSFFTVVSCI